MTLPRFSIATALLLAACTTPSVDDPTDGNDIEPTTFTPDLMPESGTVGLASVLTPPASGPLVKLAQPKLASGDDVTVVYEGLAGDPNDWLAFADPEAPDQQYGIAMPTEGRRSGTLTFKHIPAGTWEIRTYRGDSYERQCDPLTFTVQARTATLTIDQTPDSTSSITVEYSGMSSNPEDWITIVPADVGDEWTEDWHFTDGHSVGQMTFAAVPAGAYEVRAFVDNRYERVGTLPFVVIDP